MMGIEGVTINYAKYFTPIYTVLYCTVGRYYNIINLQYVDFSLGSEF